MSGFLTPKENLNLIMKVRERNLLWDRTHVDYKNRTIRDNTWTDIAVTLNQPGDYIGLMNVEKRVFKCRTNLYESRKEPDGLVALTT